MLDTNAISELIKPQPDRNFLVHFQQHRHAISLAAPTWHELLFGLERLPPGQKRSLIGEFLTTLADSVEILPYDQQAAAWHAQQRARLMALGNNPPLMDSQIAAVAVRFSLPLVTHNTRDFLAFPELCCLDWIGSSAQS